jgi:putative transposase
VRQILPAASERQVYRVFGLSRWKPRKTTANPARTATVDEHLAEFTRFLIARHATAGYRLLWALLRREHGMVVAKETAYRILKIKGWFVHQRAKTPRPRARGLVSEAARSNERWAMDVTHIACGEDGWAHLAAVIDCHDRELVGFELALRGRAKEAERAIEDACIRRC